MGRFKKFICCFTTCGKEDSYEISRRDATDHSPLEETSVPKLSVYQPYPAQVDEKIHSLNETADFNPALCSTKVHPDAPLASDPTSLSEESASSCSDFGLTDIPSYPGPKLMDSSALSMKSTTSTTEHSPMEEKSTSKLSVYQPCPAQINGKIHSLNDSADFNPALCSTKVQPDCPPATDSSSESASDESASSCCDFGLTDIPSYPGSKLMNSSDRSSSEESLKEALAKADVSPQKNKGVELDTTMLVEKANKDSFDSTADDWKTAVEQNTSNIAKSEQSLKVSSVGKASGPDVVLYMHDEVSIPRLYLRSRQSCAEVLQRQRQERRLPGPVSFNTLKKELWEMLFDDSLSAASASTHRENN